MKRITLMLAAMLCISFSLLANTNNTGKETTRLVKLLPDNVTTQNVKQIFGEATIVTMNNKTGELSWQYKTDDEELYIKWDTKTDKVRSLSYTSHSKQKDSWNNQYLAALEMGATTMKEAAGVLGDPANIYMQPTGSSLRYVYADVILNLRFKKGVLSDISVILTDKKDAGADN